MNKNINTIEKTYDYLTKNCNSNPIILAPNEIWNLQLKITKNHYYSGKIYMII